MAQYSIKDLEKLSGIQAHTIRIWEKRYKLVTPQRTNTNIRFYSDEDLKRILNVSLLNHDGLKISKIAKLTDEELIEQVIQLTGDAKHSSSQIESLIVAMIELNEVKFETIFNQLIKELGLDEAINKVVYPFMEKIGVLWLTGKINIAQEHFVTSIVRKKLFTAIDALGPTNVGPKVIIFLPEGEFHELGLLFYTYLIRRHGYSPVYLGQSVPMKDLAKVQIAHNAEFLFTTFVTTLNDTPFKEYVVTLSKTFKKQKIFIAGEIMQKLIVKRVTNVIRVKSPENLLELLTKV
jgi:MerR family transcriptional regulator, light-induced transcriptional regulator